jgi:hypothetical protein
MILMRMGRHGGIPAHLLLTGFLEFKKLDNFLASFAFPIIKGPLV